MNARFSETGSTGRITRFEFCDVTVNGSGTRQKKTPNEDYSSLEEFKKIWIELRG